MLRRFAQLLCLCALAAVLMPISTAQAVVIDKELQELISGKSGEERFPVLMVFDEPVSVDPDETAAVSRLSPEKRRKRVVTILKKKAGKKVARAVASLYTDDGEPRVSDIRLLYLATAISFDGPREVIHDLASLDDRATLYLNKKFEIDNGISIDSHAAMQTSSDVPDTAWSVTYINADRVWQELGLTGQGVVVGHIDSGVALQHTDLVNRLWTNPGEIPGNGLDDDGNGYVDDVHGWDFGDDDNNPQDDARNPGHGTHTAGTIAGDGSGGTMTGVAPGAKLMVLKVKDASGATSLSRLWEAEQYCLENGARIISMSMGFEGEYAPSYLRSDRSGCDNLRDAGIALFNSAGNEHFAYEPPIECAMTARIPAPWVGEGVPYSSTSAVITVGGTRYLDDGIYATSSLGPVTWGHVDPWEDWPYNPGPGLTKPDVVAPGNRVNSLALPSGYSGDSWTGTSMACPHVTGIAALMLEKNPSLSPVGLDSLLETTARDLGSMGKDNVYGAGIVDAFAAVSATPISQTPYLVVDGLLPDQEGDGVIYPGEISKLSFQLINNSVNTDAHEVSATMTIVGNSLVSVDAERHFFTDIAHSGGLGDNLGDGFTISVDAAAEHGYKFTMLLTVSAGLGFERTFDIPWHVGLPEYKTHDSGDIYLTVTDQGIIGYMGMLGTEGQGMGQTDQASSLFLGSFWAGTDEAYVCNRDYTGNGDETYEWIVRDKPSGRVSEVPDGVAEQVFSAAFTDAGHATPQGLEVEQTSYAYGPGDNGSFIVMEYVLINTSDTDLMGLHAGVFCDYDIFDTMGDEGGVDETRRLVYQYEGDGPYYGVALLGSSAATNLTLISNSDYVYANMHISDAAKIQFLDGSLNVSTSSETDDWSVLASTTVNLQADGGSSRMAYALVYGATLAELQENVDRAQAVYQPVSPVQPIDVPKLVRLEQNHPNPFNPSTVIRFSLPRDEHVDLKIYDISGRRVRSLVSGVRTEGDNQVMWNGLDDGGGRVSSGVYFYKLVTSERSLTRKMMLVK